MNALNPQLTQALSELKPIHEPPPISWWPLSPGWWILAVMAIAVIIFCGWHLFRYWQRFQHKRRLLAELDKIWQHYQQHQATSTYLHQANQYLKQTLLQTQSRANIASLSGQQWLKILDQASHSKAFTEGVGQALGVTSYQPNPLCNTEHLHALLINWTKKASWLNYTGPGY
ncbi:DUF4381 domain-containing protein [Zooshikella ganghwensis]|uniref:DUF4381 domain-containing protein n=1 Tax=Zooshikella ganghwensis TaxID=202772 RepID=A0A4P9VPB5_9GAMM|nr:DUF4381 domain-containing protein [Zooshikella ganghwensis]RDH43960.1 DUF4381 domain-containing protein [Zooshikella ganghwensis]